MRMLNTQSAFYKIIYKNITIPNLLIWMIFDIVGVINNKVTCFIKHGT